MNRCVILAFFICSCFGQDLTTMSPDTAPDGSENCGYYKRLARLTNPLDHRGEVCCEDLGCFSNMKGTPWEHMAQLPDCMMDIKPEYLLFTPENSTAQMFDYFTLNETVGNLRINPVRPFYVIIHGYNTQWPSGFMFAMKDELIRLGNNVLLVKWTSGSNKKNYIKAAANTRTVGKALGVVVQTMVDRKLVNLSITTLIGFSLGAHTAGYAGTNLPNLRRIIALDPAGPLFVCEDVQARLDTDDAKFVQAIHTNGVPFLSGGLGTLEPMAHVDFYVNGGRVQPGCTPPLVDITRFDFSKADVSCSHRRCPWYFIEMLRQIDGAPHGTQSCSFTSFPCDDDRAWLLGKCFSCPSNGCPLPGYILDLGTHYRGKFFFNTHTDNTTDGGYCGKQFLITMVSNKDVKGAIAVSFYQPDSDKSDQSIFQKSMSTLEEGVPKSSIILAPWQTPTVHNITVHYSKYKSKFRKDGPTTFILTNVTISDQFGVRFTSCSEVEVETDKPSVVKFAPEC